ncbi:Brix-domain-containing protein [Lepidopterella palustris CBS 459.81]|uniref:Ribosome production factor 2 homolog n=1 Tax=Lepidopterella palustris CBS 459.81 TaxID=1314670 RepID=A0A8E2EBH8_9PEZI|nr:Brix-domain-containing protein [Lepidopterella palustris CBS 459.81]
MLRQIIPKNARSKRILEKKAPQNVENTKMTLFLKYTSTSQIVQLAMADLMALKRPLVLKFNKKNDIHPFEDPASLEFFSEKNDCSLLVFGHNSKKRPHGITFIRTFSHRILDMLELYIDPDSFRQLTQFKGKKPPTGLKPLISFSGTPFESPTPNKYTLAKSLFVDFFRGQETSSVDVEGLRYMVHISAGDEIEGQPAPRIHLRVYTIRTRKSGQRLPRVEVEEMGPRIDFRVGREKQADDAMLKEALKKPKGLEPKTKKNVETDIMGDKVGRIHVGKQDLSGLQTRKMKGLKRSRNDGDDETMVAEDDLEGEIPSPKRQSMAV